VVLSPSRVLFLPAALLTTLAAFLLWRWLGEPVALPDAPAGRLHCLSYTPFEPGQIGATAPGAVSAARIAEDLRRLKTYTDCLRVYTPLGNTPRVVETASGAGLRVLLGAWIGSDIDQNEKEIRAALGLARRYPQTVTAIVVGNEVLLRREMSGERLAGLIRDVKEQSPVPVAYGDVAHFIEKNPSVARAADLLLIHLLPYWDDPEPPPVEAAPAQVIRIYDQFRAGFPGKTIWIGETGWPSKGRMRGPARPGLVQEARFVREFVARAAAAGIPYNLIEAVDQPWKRPTEGTVGGYWGILDEQRAPKFALQGPVSAWPQWRAQFIASAALALAMLMAGLGRKLDPAGWLGWSAMSLALGMTLVWQWDFVTATSQSRFGYATGVAAAALSVAAALILGTVAAGVPRTAAASLADLARGSRAPLALVRSGPLRQAAFLALATLPAAWFAITLAFDPRHRDIPLAYFALPALAAAARFATVKGTADHREEALLAAVLLVCGLMQLEPANAQSVAWLAICVLLALPWLGALRSELARVTRSLMQRQVTR
jgi:exo-beta-1,3-glucanase (GH17 family)